MKSGIGSVRFSRARRAALALCLALSAGAVSADEYTFVVQPIQSPEATREAFEPMAEYLSKATGHTIKLVTARNFVGYWETMKKGDKYDLILDAAHFTDFRVKRMDYTPLAKVANVVSMALVTHEDNPIFEPKELVGKKIALLSSPSMDAVRLAQMFPNPLRQPVIVRVNDSAEAAQKIQEGQAAGALVPTPMVGGFPYLYTVQTTPQVPHMALSASPRVPPHVQERIKQALIEADQTPEGQKLLEHLRFPSFEPADAEMYDGYRDLLQGVYGY